MLPKNIDYDVLKAALQKQADKEDAKRFTTHPNDANEAKVTLKFLHKAPGAQLLQAKQQACDILKSHDPDEYQKHCVEAPDEAQETEKQAALLPGGFPVSKGHDDIPPQLPSPSKPEDYAKDPNEPDMYPGENREPVKEHPKAI